MGNSLLNATGKADIALLSQLWGILKLPLSHISFMIAIFNMAIILHPFLQFSWREQLKIKSFQLTLVDDQT